MTEKELLVRAVNFMIIKKVVNAMGITADRLYKHLEISESTVDKFIQMDESGAGSRWNYGQVATKWGIDPKIFSGKRLLKINGEVIKEVKRQYVQREKKAVNQDIKENLARIRKQIVSEEGLWGYIMENLQIEKGARERERAPRGKKLMGKIERKDMKWVGVKASFLREVKNQVNPPSFDDAELWKIFWYFYQNEKNVLKSK